MKLLIATIGTFILSLIVFGGGQVFIPLFLSLWELMGIDKADMDTIITLVNATPGVIGTQLALITGYLVMENHWIGWLSMLLTYSIFAITSFTMVWLASNAFSKFTTSDFTKNLISILRPVIIGIIIALSIQLFISTAFPNFVFNRWGEYIAVKKTFITGWRFYIAISWTIFAIFESAYFYKKGIGLPILIVTHIPIGILILAPWI